MGNAPALPLPGDGGDGDDGDLVAELLASLFGKAWTAALGLAGKPTPIPVQVLTMREVVRYFVEERPIDPDVDHGALLVRRKRRRTLCFQVFLDAAEKPCVGLSGEVYGRMLRVGEFDPELGELVAAGQGLVLFPAGSS